MFLSFSRQTNLPGQLRIGLQFHFDFNSSKFIGFAHTRQKQLKRGVSETAKIYYCEIRNLSLTKFPFQFRFNYEVLRSASISLPNSQHNARKLRKSIIVLPMKIIASAG